jgi:hypothetical protein
MVCHTVYLIVYHIWFACYIRKISLEIEAERGGRGSPSTDSGNVIIWFHTLPQKDEMGVKNE